MCWSQTRRIAWAGGCTITAAAAAKMQPVRWTTRRLWYRTGVGTAHPHAWEQVLVVEDGEAEPRHGGDGRRRSRSLRPTVEAAGLLLQVGGGQGWKGGGFGSREQSQRFGAQPLG